MQACKYFGLDFLLFIFNYSGISERGINNTLMGITWSIDKYTVPIAISGNHINKTGHVYPTADNTFVFANVLKWQ